MSVESRLSKLESSLNPPNQGLHVVYGDMEEPGLYQMATSDDEPGRKMTRDEVMNTVQSGTVIFVEYGNTMKTG